MKRKRRRPPQDSFKFKLPRLQWRWPTLNYKLWLLFFLAILLLLFRLALIPRIVKTGPAKIQKKTVLEVQTTVRAVLKQFGIDQEHLSVEDSVTRVLVPKDFSFFVFYGVLRDELEDMGAEIIDCHKSGDHIFMSVGEDNEAAEHLLFVKSRRIETDQGRAAIIIDDFGYSFSKLARSFVTLSAPITISVIPGLAASQKVAEIAHLHGKQVLVHMPMEPEHEKVVDEGFTLITGQDPGKVSLRLRQAFAQIPVAVGMNNHQGSKATQDPALMDAVMGALKDLNKFFIDSRTSSQSIAYQTAKKYDIPSGESRLFLDAEDNTAFIRRQLARMAQMAKDQGSVIAIGHVRKRTLAVLEEMLPTLKASGVTFVFVSEVIN
ncbi:divergent polysaccharide deacetylase family protein [candidate division KSB1 bacterium]|nr:divergent polysaccharide deacetylase family protein [candidate division KSB1 bacterium]